MVAFKGISSIILILTSSTIDKKLEIDKKLKNKLKIYEKLEIKLEIYSYFKLENKLKIFEFFCQWQMKSISYSVEWHQMPLTVFSSSGSLRATLFFQKKP